MDDLKDRVVVVTGGSRGMGREMVVAFAERGAHVAIASRKQENCMQLAAFVTDRYGVRALPVGCNVSNWSDCDRLTQAVYDEFGRVDVLINNAGLSPLYPSLAEVDEALFDKVIGVNLKGPFRLSAKIGARMVEAGGGAIINISSIAAIRPNASAIPYAAAKAGLNSLTEGLAQAYAPTVRVNTIQPGAFLTDIASAWTPEGRAHMENSAALQRCGNPNEIVGAALYFATSASSFCTGAVLRIDGGTA
ncbi:SDR family NAD(P)-dependent oxidoreductase [Mycobacterium sp. shizuoka-1]|uniref:SDR family NAD(P)-dependent oxidoreductase n=1 Tax=Mycobacterium sp. shizuoka-1 TaxID=2039281 RepID=UPI000C067BCB|nr:SDR family oxidoreductase [Mycobacterium sp. shizuoka-1]GAY17655.1 putative short chain dehydrogenase/reductase [Mycobacterium sp. shizuoka-1]